MNNIERSIPAIVPVLTVERTRESECLTRRFEETAAPFRGAPPIRSAAVVGAAGARIARLLITHGVSVALCDPDHGGLDEAVRRIKRLMNGLLDRGELSLEEARDAMNRLTPTVRDDAILRADLIVEAADQDLDVKRNLMKEIENRARPSAGLATVAATIPVSRIAEALKQAERLAGLHFALPELDDGLVELVCGEETSELALRRLSDLFQRIGRTPFIVNDSPGFLINRSLIPCLLEAARLFEQGMEAGEIDEAMMAFGMRMGPLRMVDELGLDAVDDIASQLRTSGGRRYDSPSIFARMKAAGRLGRQAGAGFYDYSNASLFDGGAAEDLRGSGTVRRTPRGEVVGRLVALMINESLRCLSDEVVDDPKTVDLALIRGAGFPASKGGPLRHLDDLGAPTVFARLTRFSETLGGQFEPAGLLRELAELDQTVYPRLVA